MKKMFMISAVALVTLSACSTVKDAVAYGTFGYAHVHNEQNGPVGTATSLFDDFMGHDHPVAPIATPTPVPSPIVGVPLQSEFINDSVTTKMAEVPPIHLGTVDLANCSCLL